MMLLFSYLVVSDFLRPHILQHTRLLCPSPSPKVCPNSCPLHRWCHPAISSSDALFCFSVLPSIRDFSSETAVCIRWPKYWSFSFASLNTPSNEYLGLISLKIDWIDLFAVQGTLWSLLRHHSWKALWRSAFFMVQFSQPVYDHWGDHSLDYMDLCWQSNASVFSTVSRFVIAFMPRRNGPQISWLQSSSAMILKTRKRKSVTASTFSPSICHEVMGPDAMVLVFF